MFYNAGGIEVFYDWKGDPVEVLPRFIAAIPEAPINGLPTIHRIRSIIPHIEKASSIYIARRYALGDVLMLIPVVRQLKKRFPGRRWYLGTGSGLISFIDLLNDGVFDLIFGTGRAVVEYDLGILLDGILEWDHRLPKYFHKPRVNIYREFLGLATAEPLDWGSSSLLKPRGVVFCSGGKAPVRCLPSSIAQYIESKLRTKFRDVLHINDDKQVKDEELLEAVRRARVCVTVDSAPLWISHFTRTPVVLITGATRGKERLPHHPLQPDGVAEISLSAVTGCEPCFERMKECRGEVDCFKVSPQYVWKRIEKDIEEVMWKTRKT